MTELDEAIPTKVNLEDDMLWVTLKDGRVIGTPLDWYPFLEAAPPEQLSNIQLKWDAIWWTDLEEGLSVEGMLKGVNPREEVRAVTRAEKAVIA
jgi:hypothetical protein